MRTLSSLNMHDAIIGLIDTGPTSSKQLRQIMRECCTYCGGTRPEPPPAVPRGGHGPYHPDSRDSTRCGTDISTP